MKLKSRSTHNPGRVRGKCKNTPKKAPKGPKKGQGPKIFHFGPHFRDQNAYFVCNPSYIHFFDKKTIFFSCFGLFGPFSRNFSKDSCHFCIYHISGSIQDLETKISIFTNLMTQSSKIKVSRLRNNPLTLI